MSAPRDDWDEALSIAVEHVGWCRSLGMAPMQIARMFDAQNRVRASASWDDLTWAIAIAWTHLGNPRRRGAA